jgi:hypothetical protein
MGLLQDALLRLSDSGVDPSVDHDASRAWEDGAVAGSSANLKDSSNNGDHACATGKDVTFSDESITVHQSTGWESERCFVPQTLNGHSFKAS